MWPCLPAVEQLNFSDPTRLRPLAFVYLCVKTRMDLDGEETLDCLTEGRGQEGVATLASTPYISPKSMMESSRSASFKLNTSTQTSLAILTFLSQKSMA